jgi:hypothetical protein
VGVTGTPLWDMARPVALAAGLGRTFGSTSGGRRTALFFTNDAGVYDHRSGRSVTDWTLTLEIMPALEDRRRWGTPAESERCHGTDRA